MPALFEHTISANRQIVRGGARPGDRRREAHEKLAGSPRAGVLVVVLDPKPRTAHVFGADAAPMVLGSEDEVALPGLLGGFRVRVGRFFE
jgi:hypothetical protein